MKYQTRLSSNLKRKQIYQGQIINVALETVQVTADSPPATFEIVRHPGGAAVVAINNLQQVCLLKQYRHAVAQWLWELPAGKIDNQEPPEITASRELLEEAGISASQWVKLGEIVSSPGVFDERLHLYLAQTLTQTQTDHELHEYIEIHWIDFTDALNMALDGQISDAKSVIGLLRAQFHLQTL